MPQLRSVFPPLDPQSRAARASLVELATAAVGDGDAAAGDGYAARLDRLAQAAVASPDEARRLLEAAATMIALAVGRAALDETADFVREFDEVDFATEALSFARSVEETLSSPSLAERPDSPLGGWPG